MTSDNSAYRPSRAQKGLNDLLEDRERALSREALIAARVYELQTWGREDHNYQRALAWYEALSASLGGAKNVPAHLSAVVELLWQQHVFGEPDQSQILEFYSVIRGGDRFIVIQTSRGFRRTVARLGGFLFEDVREILDQDAAQVSQVTNFWVYAPVSRTQRRNWQGNLKAK